MSAEIFRHHGPETKMAKPRAAYPARLFLMLDHKVRAIRAAPTDIQTSYVILLLLSWIATIAFTGIALKVGLIEIAIIAVFYLVAIIAVPNFAVFLFFSSLYFQGLLTAVCLPIQGSSSTINAAQASSLVFVIAAVAALAVSTPKPEAGYALKKEIGIATPSLLLLAIYTIYGLTQAEFQDVAVYARLFANGWLAFLAAPIVCRKLQAGEIENAVRVCLCFVAAYGIAEVLLPEQVHNMFNIDAYLVNKSTSDGSYISEIYTLSGQTRSFLNLSGEFGIHLRLPIISGPNVHVITFSYICAIGSTLCFLRKRFKLGSALVVMMVLSGSKGAILLFLLYFASRILRKSRIGKKYGWTIEAGLYLNYIFVFCIYGRITGDYHYLGLVGAVRDLLNHPWGHGVGIGGNLSALGERADFGLFERQGYASFAIESGMGVLFYQVGMLAIIFVGGLLWLAKELGSRSLYLKGVEAGQLEWARIIIPVLVINSLFQEEAFSPAVWGFVMFIAGAAYHRSTILLRLRGERRVAPEFSSPEPEGRRAVKWTPQQEKRMGTFPERIR